MTLKELIQQVFSRLALIHRTRLLVILLSICGYLALGAALLSLIWLPLGIGLFLLGAAVLLVVLKRRGKFNSPTEIEACSLLDQQLSGKERFVTYASLKTPEDPRADEKRAMLERQLHEKIALSSAKKLFPELLTPRLRKMSYSIAPVWFIALAIILKPFWFAEDKSAEAAMVRELLQQERALPPEVKDELKKLANVLQTNDLTTEEVQAALNRAQSELDEARSEIDKETEQQGKDAENSNGSGSKDQETPKATPTPTPTPKPNEQQQQQSKEQEEKQKNEEKGGEKKEQEQQTQDDKKDSEKKEKDQKEQKKKDGGEKDQKTDVQHSKSQKGDGKGDKGEGDKGEGDKKSDGASRDQKGSGEGKDQQQQGEQGNEQQKQGQQGNGQQKEGDQGKSGEQQSQSGSQGEKGAEGQKGSEGEKQGEQQGDSTGKSAGEKQSSEQGKDGQGEKPGEKGENGNSPGSALNKAQQVLDKIKDNRDQAGKSPDDKSSQPNPNGSKDGDKGKENKEGKQQGDSQGNGKGEKQPNDVKKDSEKGGSGGEKQGEQKQNPGEKPKDQGGGKGAEGQPKDDKEKASDAAPNPDASAGSKRFGEDAADEDAKLAGSDEQMKSVSIPSEGEKYDTRFTGKDGKVEKNDKAAKYKTDLSKIENAAQDPVKNRAEQSIPLEYRDLLE